MPEGHTVHRIADLFARVLGGRQVSASSPQGRFHDGAQLISGSVVVDVTAVGKQLFLSFDNDRVVRVHLGIYGAWDVATLEGESVRAGSAKALSLGAPRVSKTRIAEAERQRSGDEPFPPAPVGAVRLRLATSDVVADLRGPTACEVITPEEALLAQSALGPDPLVDSGLVGEEEFVRRLSKTARPVGIALMDQSVVAGIGNVYRAEILFRHRLDPYRPAHKVSAETAAELWRDWGTLLEDGVKTGVMLTRKNMSAALRRQALANPRERYYVYKRHGQPCRECGAEVAMDLMAARKLYYCPACQGS